MSIHSEIVIDRNILSFVTICDNKEVSKFSLNIDNDSTAKYWFEVLYRDMRDNLFRKNFFKINEPNKFSTFAIVSNSFDKITIRDENYANMRFDFIIHNLPKLLEQMKVVIDSWKVSKIEHTSPHYFVD